MASGVVGGTPERMLANLHSVETGQFDLKGRYIISGDVY
jgi:hypothetical protein